MIVLLSLLLGNGASVMPWSILFGGLEDVLNVINVCKIYLPNHLRFIYKVKFKFD